MKRIFAISGMLLYLALNPSILSAHHGYAAYDTTKTLSLKGTITDFQMVNPHSTLAINVKNDKGVVEEWTAEFGHVRMLREDGWKPDSLKPGDKVTLYYHPPKNGAHAVDLVKVEFPDGHVLWGFGKQGREQATRDEKGEK